MIGSWWTSGRLIICQNAPAEIKKEIRTVPAPIIPITLLEKRLPKKPLVAEPTSGKTGISQSKLKKFIASGPTTSTNCCDRHSVFRDFGTLRSPAQVRPLLQRQRPRG